MGIVLTMKLYLVSWILVVTTYSASLETSSTSSVRTSVSRLMSGSTNNRTRSSAIVQSVDCYDYNNQGGDRLHLTDYTPSLRNYNFDNRIESCCFTGIWLLYDLDNYGKGTTTQWTGGPTVTITVLTYLQPSSIEHPVLDSQELLTIGTTTLSTCTLTSISLETRSSLITTLQCSTMTIVLSPLWSLDVIHGPSTSMTPTEDTPCACILRVQPSVLQASTAQDSL